MEQKRRKRPNKNKIILKRNLFIFLILVVIAILILVIPSRKKTKIEESEFSDISKIFELATLECYYHDVAEFQKDPDGLFKYGVFQYGAKKMWMEYNGIIKIGIDAGEVKVSDPDKNGVVKVFVPDAKILEVNAQKDSMSTPIEETGVFTKITAEEKAQAFSVAQKTMRENAEADQSLLNKAKSNAKELLKQYIQNVGEQMGKTYQVEWVKGE